MAVFLFSAYANHFKRVLINLRERENEGLCFKAFVLFHLIKVILIPGGFIQSCGLTSKSHRSNASLELMSFLKVPPRHLSVFVLTGCSFALVLLLLSGNQTLPLPSYSFVDHATYSIVDEGTSRCNSHCLINPFSRPGMLHIGSEVSDTRWIPFPQNSSDINNFHSSEVYDRETPPEAFHDACPQYMKQLSLNSSSVDWIRDRTVLFIGSSHDRLADLVKGMNV